MSDDDQTESYYDALGVDPNASKDEIREAYRDRLSEAQADVTNAETAKRGRWRSPARREPAIRSSPRTRA